MPKVSEVPRLDDGTVLLRQPRLEDLPAVLQLGQDPQSQQWISLPSPYTEEDGRNFLTGMIAEGWSRGDRHTFAVTRSAAEQQLLGTIDLHQFRAGTAELGISMGSAARGSGVSLRAVRLLVGYAFEQLELEFLYWFCSAPNWASRKLAWKAGFRFEALLRGYGDYHGMSTDMWLLSLRRGESTGSCEPWLGPDSMRKQKLKEQ